MDRKRYDDLLNLAERGDLDPDERREFIEMAESLADAPGGIHGALPSLIKAAAHLPDPRSPAAHYVREAIRLLRRME